MLAHSILQHKDAGPEVISRQESEQHYVGCREARFEACRVTVKSMGNASYHIHVKL